MPYLCRTFWLDGKREMVRIDTKRGRDGLQARREPYWYKLSRDRHLGLRKLSVRSVGSWIARFRDEVKLATVITNHSASALTPSTLMPQKLPQKSGFAIGSRECGSAARRARQPWRWRAATMFDLLSPRSAGTARATLTCDSGVPSTATHMTWSSILTDFLRRGRATQKSLSQHQSPTHVRPNDATL